MTTQKSTINSLNSNIASSQQSSPGQLSQIDAAVTNFIQVYNARAAFFSDSFIKKVIDVNRKALAELQKHSLTPTQMDLRDPLAKCVKANTPDDHLFRMNDGKVYSMFELKTLVPDWSSMALNSLMESDPALADKLMSPVQWNAKSAFEVTFTSAMNELKDIKKNKIVTGSYEHYLRWVIKPLEKAIEHVKEVAPPANAPIGYGDRISLSEAMVTAMGIHAEFKKLLSIRD